MQACYAALALATAAAVVCTIPVFGWIVCLILSAAAALVTLIGIVNALNDKGNPTDVNPNMTDIHSAEGPDGGGADILVVKEAGFTTQRTQAGTKSIPLSSARRSERWANLA